MKLDVLNRNIDATLLLKWLESNMERCCEAIALLFFASPLIEMVVCLFNRAERIYPLGFYPRLVVNIILPIVVVLGVCVLTAAVYRVRTRKIKVLRRLKDRRMYVYFALMALWMVLASWVNGKSVLTDFGDMYRNEPLRLVLSYVLVFLFCASFIPDARKENLALFSVAVSLVLCAYSSIRHQLALQGVEASCSPYSVAVFLQHNHYGYYLAVHIMLSAALFVLSQRRSCRIVALAGLLANTAVLSMNNTFGAWLACFTAFIFQIVVLRIVYRRFDRRSVVALAAFLGVTFIMSFWTQNIFSSITQFLLDVGHVMEDPLHADDAGTTRWRLWKFTAGKIAERPVFGFGNEGINDMLYAATGSSRPHNEILQYAVFYGVPAALLYVAGVLHVYLDGYRRRSTLDRATLACLIGAFGYFVSSLFGNTMFYTAPFFFILLGMGVNGDGSR